MFWHFLQPSKSPLNEILYSVSLSHFLHLYVLILISYIPFYNNTSPFRQFITSISTSIEGKLSSEFEGIVRSMAVDFILIATKL